MNITTSCNFTTDITAVNAWKACGAIMQQELATDPFVEFRNCAFGSALYMIIVALIAIVANALLLVVFLVDPLKMLRSPPSYFLIGLAISDLLTALILLPIYSGCFIMMYLQTPRSGLLLSRDVLLHVGLTQGGIALTISYLVVSAFSFTHLVIVSSPLKYGRMISSRKSILCVLVLYLYAILFWLSEFFGASTDLLKKIDVFWHSFFIILTIIFYTLLHFSFKRKIAASRNLFNDTSVRGEESSQNRIQRQFITVNLILISILIICSLPGLVFWLTVEFWLGKPLTPKTFIVNLMIDDMMYLKIMLDPFVYAWRLPKYREALKKIFPVLRKCYRKAKYERCLEASVLNQSREFVVTLEIKRIENE